VFSKFKITLISIIAFSISADTHAFFNKLKPRSFNSCLVIEQALNDDGCILSSSRYYAGKQGSMHLKLYTNDSGDEAFDQPIIVVAPYPGAVITNGSGMEQNLDLVFRNAFMGATPSEVKSRYPNSDIFLFSYEYIEGSRFGAGDHIQLNAFTVLEGIERINERNSYKSSNAILGTSLGGVVSKYALGYANKNGIETNVRTWVTIDSPLKGANMPLAYQRLPLFIDSMLDDFNDVGIVSLSTFDFIASAIDFLMHGGTLSGLSDLTSEAKKAIRDVRAMVQMSYDNIHSTSSKQLLINHVVDKDGNYRSNLLNELRYMPLSKDIRKVVFTNASLEESYTKPQHWSSSKFIESKIDYTHNDLEAAGFRFSENSNPNRNENLFYGYARKDRFMGNDYHVKEDTSLTEFPNYQYVNSVPGTNIGITRNVLFNLNKNILKLESHEPGYARCVNCKEPNFIPTFSALDIDPDVYGTDLNKLKGNDLYTTIQKLEAASPFDKIHHVSSRIHGYEFDNTNMAKLDSELLGRHDLAYLIPILNNVLF